MALGVALTGSEAQANPQRGEARNPMRDADRVYSVVAGEGDGSATVQNPANLGFLRGINFIADVAWTQPQAMRRGSGVGTFLGIPVRDWFALGVGYQFLSPDVDGPGVSGALQSADDAYSKFTMALALPLMRWAKGLSIGVNYSRLFSRQNFWAANVNQVDVGVDWWANRIIALGVVFRGLNQPRVGPDVLGLPADLTGCGTEDPMMMEEEDSTSCVVSLPLTIEPEIAFRPGGTDAFELGVGTRISPLTPGDNQRFAERVFQPRGRVLLNLRGVRVFAEAEAYTYNDVSGAIDSPQQYALRVNAGLGFDLQNLGMLGGANMGFASPGATGLNGGVGRIRISQERYRSAAHVRPRTVIRFPLAKYRGERGMHRLTRQIEKLGRRGASVLLLETKHMGLSYAGVEEVREALLRFRARGGKVVFYMDGGSLRTYFLASVGNRIISHPHTRLGIVGLSLRTLYWGELIKRLGGNAEFVRIAEYKSTPEVYSNETASEPARQQRRQLQADGWNHILRMIARDRGRDPKAIDAWIDAAPHAPEDAVELGVVDDVAWPDELDDRLEDWLGKKVRIESPPRTKKHRSDFGAQPRVAVLYVNGDLVTGPSFTIPILGRRFVGSDTIVKSIKELRKDANVRAVVLRVNTRGGSVFGAAAITRELELLAEKKPLVVSLGGVAASAGYYIATAGDYIVTDATTITGSIGIFYPKVDLSGFLNKFGVGVDIDSLGENAAMYSWFKPYSEGERAKVMETMKRDYDIFVERVAEARAMSPQQADNLAGGRIWIGARAIEVGLADRYGGLREAIIRARRMAGMKVDEGEVVEYPPKPGLLTNLRTIFGLNINLPIGSIDAEAPMALNTRPRLLGPLFTILEQLPGAIWLADAPEPLALDTHGVSFE
jgi:protease-4